MKILLAATGSESFSGAAKCLLELANGLRSKGNSLEKFQVRGQKIAGSR